MIRRAVGWHIGGAVLSARGRVEYHRRGTFGAWPGAESKPGTFRAGAAETFGTRHVASDARLSDGRNIKGEAPPDWGKIEEKTGAVTLPTRLLYWRSFVK